MKLVLEIAEVSEDKIPSLMKALNSWLLEELEVSPDVLEHVKPEVQPSEEQPKRRRGRPRKNPESVQEVVSSVTDEDMIKAATLAAETIGPKGVENVLEQFGAGILGDLKPEQRQDFMDQLEYAVINEKVDEFNKPQQRRRRRSG